jgi:hypothetical protein
LPSPACAPPSGAASSRPGGASTPSSPGPPTSTPTAPWASSCCAIRASARSPSAAASIGWKARGGVTADQLTGSADLQIFFPDLGLGAVDWFSRFEFRHREVSGDGQAFDVDADVYHVTGGARWFAAPDVALVFAGSWQRVEEEFFSEDDQTGSLMVHGRLPLPLGPVSIELFAGGSAGVSEYKESPFRGDRRLVYGGRAGLTLRLFSGRSLIESMRQYD